MNKLHGYQALPTPFFFPQKSSNMHGWRNQKETHILISIKGSLTVFCNARVLHIFNHLAYFGKETFVHILRQA